ncbi:hypothetical protein [Frankia tisae]|uniref:hypothetical protein n=1 Tax=Frankia tisae TaxID=2950104 RepID=UPI0021BE9402|nr:hypothetical protein [Frankia tisae]
MRLPEMVSIGADNIAPTGGIYNRYLHHRRELGLDLDTINALADGCRAYTNAVLAIYTEMTTLAGQIHEGLRKGRPLAGEEKAALFTKIAQRSALGRRAEGLYVRAVVEGHAMLTADQLALAEKILGEERDEAWSAFDSALGRAAPDLG